jgi:hypothetical protein
MPYEEFQRDSERLRTLAPRAKVRRRPRRQVAGYVPKDFEEFYRANLRFVVGVRMRRLEVAELYATWAVKHGKQSMNMRDIKRTMVRIGHVTIESNGMYYGDLGLARSFPDVPDNYPALSLPPEIPIATIRERLETVMTLLSALHAEFVRADQAPLILDDQ